MWRRNGVTPTEKSRFKADHQEQHACQYTSRSCLPACVKPFTGNKPESTAAQVSVTCSLTEHLHLWSGLAAPTGNIEVFLCGQFHF